MLLDGDIIKSSSSSWNIKHICQFVGLKAGIWSGTQYRLMIAFVFFGGFCLMYKIFRLVYFNYLVFLLNSTSTYFHVNQTTLLYIFLFKLKQKQNDLKFVPTEKIMDAALESCSLRK